MPSLASAGLKPVAAGVGTDVSPLGPSPNASFESDEGQDDVSEVESDSLDSDSPRKRQRISPPAEHESASALSSLSVPSRVKRKADKTSRTPQDSLGRSGSLQGAILAPTDPSTSFEALGVRPWLVQSLANMAIRRPTGIQKGCIPEILKGRDCIGGSRTGSGKTVAFAVPILQTLAEDPSAVFAVVLTPTRYDLDISASMSK